MRTGAQIYVAIIAEYYREVVAKSEWSVQLSK